MIALQTLTDPDFFAPPLLNVSLTISTISEFCFLTIGLSAICDSEKARFQKEKER